MRIATALVVLVLVYAAVSIARRSEPTFPVSDEALIELSTLNAAQGHQLLGPYSRYAWHHPGPLLFYILAPFYAAGGFRSPALSAGALTINLAAFAIAVWILVRRGGLALTVVFCVLFGSYLARLGDLQVSAWNAHVAIVSAAALLVLAAAVASGWMRLLPAVAFLASFVVQTHVALLPLAAVAVMVALAGAELAPLGADAAATRPSKLGPYGSDPAATGPSKLGPYDRGRWRQAINRSIWVTLAVWLVPAVEQMMPGGGNVTQMWRFAVQPSGGAAMPVAFEGWAHALLAFVRPGLATPRGLLLPHDGAGWAGICAITEVLMLPIVVWWAHRRGRTLHRWLAIELFFVSGAALWAVSRIPDGIHEHDVFWISAVGVLNGAVIVAALIEWAAMRGLGAATWGRPDAVRAAALAVVSVMIVGVVADGLYQLRTLALRSRTMTRNDRRILNATDLIRSEIKRLGARRPKVLIDQPVWDAAAGVTLQLRKQGISLAVPPGLERMFSGTAAADGSEDVEIAFCGGPCHDTLAARPDNVVLLHADGLAIDVRALKN